MKFGLSSLKRKLVGVVEVVEVDEVVGVVEVVEVGIDSRSFKHHSIPLFTLAKNLI